MGNYDETTIVGSTCTLTKVTQRAKLLMIMAMNCSYASRMAKNFQSIGTNLLYTTNIQDYEEGIINL